MRFIKYQLSAEKLCLGERVKGGRYKPSIKTIRYSQIVGALKHQFGVSDVHAVGSLEQFKVEFLSYTLKDRALDNSKLPLRVEFLTDVSGVVYISEGHIPKEKENRFDLVMGGMVSKGYGNCRLTKAGEIDMEKENDKEGLLNTRIPIKAEDERELMELMENGVPSKFLTNIFGIKKVLRPVLGYLFDPVYEHTGVYVLSLFEGSKIVSCESLLINGGR